MNLNSWAVKWGIPAAAVDDLRRELCAELPRDAEAAPDIITEAAALNRVRLEASRKGARLWRNNRGGGYDERGRFIRYGLGNDSPAVDRVLKSSDLIGIRPIALPGGGIIGQFVAREVKKPGWKYAGTEREKAQLNFLQLVAAFGGDAQFCTDEGTL
jgi:hypothetical protein